MKINLILKFYDNKQEMTAEKKCASQCANIKWNVFLWHPGLCQKWYGEQV